MFEEYPRPKWLSCLLVADLRQWQTASWVIVATRALTIWDAAAREYPYRAERRVTMICKRRAASDPWDPRVSNTKGQTSYVPALAPEERKE